MNDSKAKKPLNGLTNFENMVLGLVEIKSYVEALIRLDCPDKIVCDCLDKVSYHATDCINRLAEMKAKHIKFISNPNEVS